MTSTDIVRIIRACKEVGLKSLEYNGLVLKFQDNDETEPVTWQPATPHVMNLVDNTAEITHNDNIPQDEEDEDYLLKSLDPLEWERRQVENG